MAELVIVAGKAGTGKSTAGRTLDPKTTYWINTDQKALPFRGWKALYNTKNKNYTKDSDITNVINILKAIPKKLPNVNVVVIDTLNRMMTDRVMRDRNIKGFEKWSNLAGGIYDLVSIINQELPEDMVVFVLCHTEEGYTDMGVRSQRYVYHELRILCAL